MLKCVLNEAHINSLCHETNLIKRYNKKGSRKCKWYVIIPYIIICCVLHRKKSIIGLTISHPITVAVKMASVWPPKKSS